MGLTGVFFLKTMRRVCYVLSAMLPKTPLAIMARHLQEHP